jgi:hypothetical protein
MDLRQCYRHVFGCVEGVRVLEDLMTHCRYWRTSFNDNERRSERYEGQRDVVTLILERCGLLENVEELARVLFQVKAPAPKDRQEQSDN